MNCLELTKEQVKKILRRMELNGASFVKIEVELNSNCFDETWVESISVDEYGKDEKYLDTIMKVCCDD